MLQGGNSAETESKHGACWGARGKSDTQLKYTKSKKNTNKQQQKVPFKDIVAALPGGTGLEMSILSQKDTADGTESRSRAAGTYGTGSRHRLRAGTTPGSTCTPSGTAAGTPACSPCSTRS